MPISSHIAPMVDPVPGLSVDLLPDRAMDIPATSKEIARVMLEQVCMHELAWLAFEPNNANTWARVLRNLRGVLVRLWLEGALHASRAQEAFFVDADMNLEDHAQDGVWSCLVGMAVNQPGEFVTLRIRLRFHHSLHRPD